MGTDGISGETAVIKHVDFISEDIRSTSGN